MCGAGSAKGAADYLALGRRYSCVALHGVPYMGGSKGDDEARRFITLIDVLYEEHCLLLLHAEGSPHDLFIWTHHDDHHHDGHHDLPPSSQQQKHRGNRTLHTNTNGVLGNTVSSIMVTHHVTSDIHELDHVDEDHPSVPGTRHHTGLSTLHLDEHDHDAHLEHAVVATTAVGGTPGSERHDLDLYHDLHEGDTDHTGLGASDLAVLPEGGSSGRSVTMVQTRAGHAVEWSGTGLQGVSLANAAQGGPGTGASFTQRASSRTVSRLIQMTSSSWLQEWVTRHSDTAGSMDSSALLEELTRGSDPKESIP